MFTGSNSAFVAKILLPLILVFAAGIIVVPVRDGWTAGWFVLVILPLIGAATWLVSNIGEIRSSSGGLLYRKWRKWYKIPATEISDIVHVYPCFAALVLNKKVLLFFFPDPDTRRLIRSLPNAVQSSDATTRIADVTPAPHKRTSFLRSFFAFWIGVVLGMAIWQIRSSGKNDDVTSTIVGVFENCYIPTFVAISVLFLAALVIAKRLDEKQLEISLAIIGLGIVYLSSIMFRLL